ncbi:MAG: hypothetical protein JGK03_26710 [Microcoleus sp. PH2017_25_DOB_D_A]|uniref:hypothetical protein n=1 Tax=unclassified Microcoleus TaxID=2642155 RepID=UPI001D78D3F6|nr:MULTISPECIES: hypothetical protein [unclassified Microcoleus]MCC3492739.1 hypothetical protein [Microcoleus sp. PH2017_16_JOR_D_A]MCC3537695.1 hypothetical protein [Microcoleus sp. PH2017_25_DOB_D_A]MCC3549883.1 hypothetical protein [Microcoleus sp. PH2017_24_DOB_U_A]TAG71061.1 MAG: hypothetical protein EAZ23_20035 [Oscillatoriales cyanobacterium]
MPTIALSIPNKRSHFLTPSKRAIAGLASGIDEGRSRLPAKTFVTKRAIGPTLSLGDRSPFFDKEGD